MIMQIHIVRGDSKVAQQLKSVTLQRQRDNEAYYVTNMQLYKCSIRTNGKRILVPSTFLDVQIYVILYIIRNNLKWVLGYCSNKPLILPRIVYR